jgi:hypothetical protein
MKFDWPGLVSNAVWAAIGAGLLYVWNWTKAWRRSRGHSAIFAGLSDPILFVFPPRPGGDRLLPHMAVEDFLAINNIISAYLRIGRTPPSKVRDHSHLTEQDRKTNNLVLICSSKSNDITREALNLLRNRLHDVIPYFEDVPGASSQIQIKWNGGTYTSDSYLQQERRDRKQEDLAVIVKAQNPWAAQHKILIVAGIRGIGTWGAAEFLKKWWQDLYYKKDASRARGTSKTGDFVALVRVQYEDHDIKDASLIHLVDLDRVYFNRETRL